MSYTGGDPSLFRHSIPNQLERYLNMDFELGAAEQKALSGLVHGDDTLDVALYLGQSYGRDPTKSSSPTLPHPTWSLRISGPESQLPPELWGSAYESLLALLPEETKGKLLEELKKPFSERATVFIALQGLLETAAKYMTLLEFANRDIDPTSSLATNREIYLNVPAVSITNLDTISRDVLKLAESLLKESSN